MKDLKEEDPQNKSNWRQCIRMADPTTDSGSEVTDKEYLDIGTVEVAVEYLVE